MSRVKDNFLYALSYYRQAGFLSFLKTLFAYFGIEFFNGELLFFIRDIHSCDISQQSDHATFKIATIEDVIKDTDFDNVFFSKRKTIQRLQQGKVLFISRHNLKTVFTLWVEYHRLNLWWFNDTEMTLPPAVAYISGVYTIPSYQYQGVAKQVESDILQYLNKQGIRYVLEAIHPKNTFAVNLAKKLNFRECFTIKYIKILLFRYYRVQYFESKITKSSLCLLGTPSRIKTTLIDDLFQFR